MGLPPGAGPGSHAVGKGNLIFEASSPAALSYRPDGAVRIRVLAREACTAARIAYRETDRIVLRRGPYVIGIGLGLDGQSSEATRELRGHFIDLFAPGNPIATSVKLTPGRVCLHYDLDRIRESFPTVAASACKTLDQKATPDGRFRFLTRGPERTEAIVYTGLQRAPRKVDLDGQPLARDSWTWDGVTQTLLLRFPNKAAGRQVVIE